MHEETIDAIRSAHRERCFAMEQRKRSDLALGSFLRLMLGWRKDLPEAERKRIAAEAAKLIKGDKLCKWSGAIAASIEARAPFEKIEKDCVKEMSMLAATLPVWQAFGKGVHGFGAVSLAVIVAEAGDLDGYDSDAKLWKRMGLAPGQNRVPPNLSKEDRKQAWIDRGYNPLRRSRMFVVGESLVKAQVRQVKDEDGKDTGERIALGPYGEAYLRRKRDTQRTHPEWWQDKDGKPKLHEKTGRPTSEHGNKDAQRYMEKKLLRDLWRAWRRTSPKVANRPGEAVSSTNPPNEQPRSEAA
jgi:hypothetical protein